MGFIKNAIVGVAIYEAIKYLTKKDEFGRTKIDELKEKAPEWVDKAKAMRDDLIDNPAPEGY